MSFHSYESRIDDDLELLSETLEEVLRSSGDPADQKYLELKARAERALEEVRNRVSHASDSYYYRAKKLFVGRMTMCTKNHGAGSVLAPQSV